MKRWYAAHPDYHAQQMRELRKRRKEMRENNGQHMKPWRLHIAVTIQAQTRELAVERLLKALRRHCPYYVEERALPTITEKARRSSFGDS